ncbi:MAG: Fe-S cluster assembly protein SufB, partial [Atopobiaceae bacterium]|nr:Fe-S cluster assembly protein SufB [Atopobiaceae bacterium]
DRSMYDFRYDDSDAEKLDAGLTPEIVREISERKGEPEWMLEHRLKSLEIYNSIDMSDWGPSIDGLDMENIVTYVKPNTDQKSDWESVPDNIKDTFDRLGIPEAERSYLAGVGAQYDSELVYHSMQDAAAKMGIVYSGIEEALHGEYADLIREKFMTLIPPTDHKFAALHGAVWSGGSFVYVPKGVKLDYPLQSYFRLNAKGAGQFEHTLIIVEPGADLHFIEGCSAPKYYEANLHAGAVELFVKDHAKLRYSTIENWSKNMFNLNTKRATVGADSIMEWVSGSFGSHVSYLYPTTYLQGARSSCEFTGITFAGATQDLDTGCKVILNGPDTTASVDTKSISKDGGINTFRSSVIVGRRADRARATVSCASLMLDDISRSDTIPAMDVRNGSASVGHEATIGRISDDTILYLMSRGCSEGEARTMVVNGFADPVSKELPMEYAIEMNNLIKLEMEGAIG